MVRLRAVERSSSSMERALTSPRPPRHPRRAYSGYQHLRASTIGGCIVAAQQQSETYPSFPSRSFILSSMSASPSGIDPSLLHSGTVAAEELTLHPPAAQAPASSAAAAAAATPAKHRYDSHQPTAQLPIDTRTNLHPPRDPSSKTAKTRQHLSIWSTGSQKTYAWHSGHPPGCTTRINPQAAQAQPEGGRASRRLQPHPCQTQA